MGEGRGWSEGASVCQALGEGATWPLLAQPSWGPGGVGGGSGGSGSPPGPAPTLVLSPRQVPTAVPQLAVKGGA